MIALETVRVVPIARHEPHEYATNFVSRGPYFYKEVPKISEHPGSPKYWQNRDPGPIFLVK
jgi:hypothetical protein